MDRSLAALLFPLLLLCSGRFVATAVAGEKGEGGCVVSPTAPIYDLAGKSVVATKEKGDCVVGITNHAAGLFGSEYVFDEENGRVKVQYFADKTERGQPKLGWMEKKDLKRFAFECGCGSTPRERESCTPFGVGGFFKMTWNACFKEGADKTRDAIAGGSTGAEGTPAVQAAPHPGAAEKALTNDDILSLVKVGLDDKLIISKIQSAKAVDFDLSTDGLVALKTAKVSNAVLDAMMKKKK